MDLFLAMHPLANTMNDIKLNTEPHKYSQFYELYK